MRILVANDNQSVLGGAETYLRAVLRLLGERGHELGLVCAYPPIAGLPTVGFPELPIWVAPRAADVLAVAEKWRPDVVFSQDYADPSVDAALARRFPTVLFMHNYSGACVSGTKYQSARGVPCSRPLGLGCLALYFPRGCGGRNPVTALSLYRKNRGIQDLMPDCRAVMVASRHMAEELARNGVPRERTVVNPYFPPGTHPDAELAGAKPRTDRVLFVGRVTALKGWRNLVDAIPGAAAALGRPLTLVVAGDGPDRERFESEARRRGIASEFLGRTGTEVRDRQMRAADVLAVPSVWPEPFGIVGIEAGCVGLPSVGYAVGGIPDWLVEGESGALGPDPPTVEGLQGALVRALRDPAHLAKLGRGAWAMAKTFSPARHVDRLESALRGS